MTINPSLPTELCDLLVPKTLRHLTVGRVSNQIFETKLRDGRHAILKHGVGVAATEVLNEKRRLEWLAGRAGAPQVIWGASRSDGEWSLVLRFPGLPSHECITTLGADVVIRILAETLTDIHRTPHVECPYTNVIAEELEIARQRVEAGTIDVDSFTEEVGQSPADCLVSLYERSFCVSDIVFTHGDYALPNVVIADDCSVGVIDWGQAGVTGRNRDFMCIEKSIARNAGPEGVKLFYEVYDGPGADLEQVRFFWEMDQYWQFFD